MNRRTITRRAASVGIFAATTIQARAVPVSIHRRGDTGERLPDHAEFWQRLPLPFTPAQAWRLLSPETQAEIGAAVIGMALAEYIEGEGRADADQFHDMSLRDGADAVSHDLLNRIAPRLHELFPDLYGPEGDHPRWAIAGGLAS